jgi:hypothetical protein
MGARNLRGAPIAAVFSISEDVSINEWTLEEYGFTFGSSAIIGTQFPGIKHWFVVERESNHYVRFILVPGFLVVFVSYMSYWVDYNQVPARITLLTFCNMASVSQIGNGYSKLPKISYETWLQTFLYVNLLYCMFTT